MKNTLLVSALAVLLTATGCAKEEAAEYAGQTSEGAIANPTESPAADVSKPSLVSQLRGNTPPSVAPKEVPIRQVIKNGKLEVRVDNVEESEDKAVKLVNGVGGYVDSAESKDLASATPRLTMKVRVPASQFDSVMQSLEGLGVRTSKSVRTEDVTASLVDMGARLKIMLAQEEVYRRMVARATGNQEMIEAQSKLMELRSQIESLQAQHQTMSKLAALSSIELALQQGSEGAVAATADPNWARESWGASLSTLGNVGRVLGSGVIWIGVFAPIWLPGALLLRALARKGHSNPAPKFDVGG